MRLLLTSAQEQKLRASTNLAPSMLELLAKNELIKESNKAKGGLGLLESTTNTIRKNPAYTYRNGYKKSFDCYQRRSGFNSESSCLLPTRLDSKTGEEVLMRGQQLSMFTYYINLGYSYGESLYKARTY